MSNRQRLFDVFHHRAAGRVVFQPRIEHWYRVNKASGRLPENYRGASLIDVFDDLGCSIRPYDWYNPCLVCKDDPSVKIECFKDGDVEATKWVTPVGSIEHRVKRTSETFHTQKYPVKTHEDARVMEYILRGRTWSFDLDLFAQVESEIGDRTAPMIFIPRVNIQRLLIDFMGFEATLYALVDDQASVERLMEVINETDDRMLKAVCASPVPFINFGDNIDQHFLPPRFLESYILPEYRRRAGVLRSAGKLTYAHWDGSVKALMPYADQTGLDGLEALTPVPQGDVTLEEIKAGLGDMVLLDGIPMVLFLPNADIGELEQCARQVIELFSPNLVLGVSDEVSPVCDIERVRFVAQIASEYAN